MSLHARGSEVLRPRGHFVVLNPLRWQFGIGAMLLLTAMFAVATYQVAYHPMWPGVWGRKWAEKQDLSDPIYFPGGVSSWPVVGDDEGSYSWSRPNNRYLKLVHMTRAPRGPNDEPGLLYVVLSQVDYSNRSYWQFDPKELSKHKYIIRIEGQDDLTLPDDAQIVEIVDGKVRNSGLRINMLEFWSYLNSRTSSLPPPDLSLEGFEYYITDLRKRVAERDGG